MAINLTDDGVSMKSVAGVSGSLGEPHRGALSFGPFRLHPHAGHLFRGDAQIALGHRAAEILTLLVRRAGETLTHDEIIRHAWPKTVVEDNNLRVQISAIRKALGPDAHTYIQNIPGRGYRFTASSGTGEPAEPAMSQRHPHVLVSKSGFFGRDNDLAALKMLLRDSRCATIVGSGGIGKTRLAERLCTDLRLDNKLDIVSLDLSLPLTGGNVATALKAVLGVANHRDTHLDDLCDYFRSRHALLVMDHCEHVIDQAVDVIATLLAQSSNLTILSSSREPLRIVGERVYRLMQLACPPPSDPLITLETILQFPSVQLFVDRVRAHDGAWHPNGQDAFPIAQLCHRLDGIPLALEFAASRVRAFGLSGMMRHLDSYPGLLTGGRRTGSSRQHAMASTLDWSFQLLSPLESAVLLRVSVFRRSFSRDMASHVARSAGVSEEAILSALIGLVEKSWLVVEPAGGANRYRLLRTTRAYAADKLADDPCFDAIKRQYVEAILNATAELVPQGRSDEAEHHQQYVALIDEVRQALDWSLGDTATHALANALLLTSRYLWFHLSQFDGFIDHAERVLSHSSAVQQNAAAGRLLVLMGPAIYNAQGPVPRMRDVLEKGLELATRFDDMKSMLFGLRGLWNYHHGLAEYAQSIHIATQYRRYTRHHVEANDGDITLATMHGINDLQKGRLRRAFKYLTFASSRSNPHFSHSADPYDFHQTIVETGMLARISWLRGNFAGAFTLLDECLDAANATLSPTSRVFALAVAACPILMWSGRTQDAVSHIAVLQNLASSHAMHHWAHYGDLYGLSLGHMLEGKRSDASAGVDMTAWVPRHVEEFSVLDGGVIPPSFLTRAKSSHPIWCSAENLRSVAVEAYRISGDGGIPQTVAALRKAIALAQSQGARAWELRATLSLAPILQRQKKCAEARTMVSRIIDRFDVDDATADLVRAHALLPDL